LNNRFSI